MNKSNILFYSALSCTKGDNFEENKHTEMLILLPHIFRAWATIHALEKIAGT